MTFPNIALRSQPFRWRRALALDGRGNVTDNETEYEVIAPGYEDWCTLDNELVIVRKASGWRAYKRETITGYDTSFGRGGQTIHCRHHAIKSADTGKALGAFSTKEAALAALQDLFWKDAVLPS